MIEARTLWSANRGARTLLFGHARVHALKAAIELDLFTAIAEGRHTIGPLAERCGAFLTKSGGTYDLAPDARAFLDCRSPTDFDSVAQFLASPGNSERAAFDDETRRLGVFKQAPGSTSSLAEIPMLAVA